MSVWGNLVGAVQPLDGVYERMDEVLKTVNEEISKMHNTATVTLDLSSWVDGKQTVTVNGVTADNVVITTAHPDSHVACLETGAYCCAQAENALTFSYVKMPTENILFNILILREGETV